MSQQTPSLSRWVRIASFCCRAMFSVVALVPSSCSAVYDAVVAVVVVARRIFFFSSSFPLRMGRIFKFTSSILAVWVMFFTFAFFCDVFQFLRTTTLSRFIIYIYYPALSSSSYEGRSTLCAQINRVIAFAVICPPQGSPACRSCK